MYKAGFPIAMKRDLLWRTCAICDSDYFTSVFPKPISDAIFFILGIIAMLFPPALLQRFAI
jgi:hypothetical protein